MQSRSASRPLENSDRSATSLALTLAITLCLSLVALHAQDLLELYAVHIQFDQTRGWIVRMAHWMLFPCFGLVGAWAARRGTQDAFMGMFAAFTSYYVAFNFRSDYIRFGTFDFFEDPYWSWVMPGLLGLTLGLVIGTVVRLRRKDRTTGGVWRTALVSAGLLLMVAAHCYYQIAVHPASAWSAFPPSRHFACLAVALACGGLVLFSRGEEE